MIAASRVDDVEDATHRPPPRHHRPRAAWLTASRTLAMQHPFALAAGDGHALFEPFAGSQMCPPHER
jgi:hypothetical protein